MRLIDADKVFDIIEGCVPAPYEDSREAKEKCLREISDAPTIDAVPVVRCKDCKHHRMLRERDMCAKNAKVLDGHEVGLTATNPDNFCSYGEKEAG